jgi:hypothetical protein
MLKQRRFITLWLLLIAVSLSAFAQEKVLLQNKAQAGQTVRYRLSGTVSIEQSKCCWKRFCAMLVMVLRRLTM